MQVRLMQRTRDGESVAAVVSARSGLVLYACVGPDPGGVLLAAVGWCRAQRYTVVPPIVSARAERTRSDAA
jgi:hypothetical protein